LAGQEVKVGATMKKLKKLRLCPI
jgi:hypothetical protein